MNHYGAHFQERTALDWRNKANTACGRWPAYLSGNYVNHPLKVTCDGCKRRLRRVGESLTAFGDAFARANAETK